MISRCEPARHLAILLPTYKGEPSVETMFSVAGATVALLQAGIEVDLHHHAGCPYISHARNILVTSARRTAATDFLFVDDDVGFPPAAVVKIARAERPFVGGVYPLKADRVRWPVTFDGEPHYDEAGLIDNINEMPTGFLRLNRTVFELMDGEEYVYLTANGSDGEIHRNYFRSGVQNGHFVTEDPDFCRRWKALGGMIHMLPGIEFSHVGRKAWKGKLGKFPGEE